ncbi:uncharacterized protein LOC111695379 [Eurytemora carolleeae]|uniref:uncharacterized protein LOC111695379 n=1 Tax=Eurytemora carolleeae TaxID=1294199 RepID=UPI000C75757B|nr:uncharacterized protein LOC111695379 [Eurytemora carolleeae]|eukprot:XP_023320466.1 uncharacterized protein LOC111695379 [Eurytemora affinis]
MGRDIPVKTDKAYRQLKTTVDKQNRKRAKISPKDQGTYVDGHRNISVAIDSKDLTKSLKTTSSELLQLEDEGDVNSILYSRQALHFGAKKQFQKSKKYFSLAHLMNPDDTEILSSYAASLLSCGEHDQAMEYAELVLRLDPYSVKALSVKAESLYHTCCFERALVIFLRVLRLSPEHENAKLGTAKCRKTILDCIGGENLFSFKGLQEAINNCKMKPVRNKDEKKFRKKKEDQDSNISRGGRVRKSDRLSIDAEYLTGLQSILETPSLADEENIGRSSHPECTLG